MDFLDNISDEARNIGAVNTVRIQRAADGRVLALEGFNTDLTGFSESIAPMLSGLPATAGALILGTGGASKAAAEAMRRFNRKFLKVSRTKSGDGLVTYSEITPELLAEYPIIINATPAGTFPAVDSCPPFPVELLGEGNVVFDMVYNPAETKLMQQAASRGARTKNGLEMLHRQALASFDIWNK